MHVFPNPVTIIIIPHTTEFLCAVKRDTGQLSCMDGKETKVTFHNFPDTTKNDLRKQWILAIRHDVGKYVYMLRPDLKFGPF